LAGPKVAAGPESDVSRAVLAARLEFAFSGQPISLLVSLLLAVMTVMMLRDAANRLLLWGWLACLIAVNAVRFVQWLEYRRHRASPDLDLGLWDRRLFVGCLFAGSVWGASALLFLPKQPALQFFLAFVIAGVSSGAVSTLSVASRAAYAFVIPCALPLALRFLFAGDPLHAVMGTMGGFYIAVVTLVTRRGHAQLTRLVTFRMEAQASRDALHDSEVSRQLSDRRLRVATEAGQIGAWEWDVRTNELVWDQRMYEIYRIDPAAKAHNHEGWRTRVHPEDLGRVESEMARALEAAEEFRSEFRIVWPQAEVRHIRAVGKVERDADGTALRIIGINLDITELRRLERVKSEFVSTISHELRTPLTSIRGSLGLAINDAAGQLPEPARELLRVADRNAQRLGALIDDLLDVEKMEGGKLGFELQSQPLLPLLEQALAANGPYAASHQVQLTLHAQSHDVHCRVDAQRVMQVMTNLLTNAVKFSPPGSTVEIRFTRSTHERVRVEVRDQGPGISPQFRPRVFAKFSQEDSSDSRSLGGAGLGLAISKALVEQMGGTIGFDTVLGRGATFFFDLPTT